MEDYKNVSGKSGVVRYEIGMDYIIVEFKLGQERFYKYTYAVTGQDNIEEMKKFAAQGSGLNTYINQNVKELYESKW